MFAAPVGIADGHQVDFQRLQLASAMYEAINDRLDGSVDLRCVIDEQFVFGDVEDSQWWTEPHFFAGLQEDPLHDGFFRFLAGRNFGCIGADVVLSPDLTGVVGQRIE